MWTHCLNCFIWSSMNVMCVGCNLQCGHEMAIYSYCWKSSDERVKMTLATVESIALKLINTEQTQNTGWQIRRADQKFRGSSEEGKGNWHCVCLWCMCRETMPLTFYKLTFGILAHIQKAWTVLPFCYKWKAAVSWLIIATLENIFDSYLTYTQSE